MIYLDTHVAAWLYADAKLLPAGVGQIIEKNDLLISPVVLLELEYLYEIGRLTERAAIVFSYLSARIEYGAHNLTHMAL